MTIGKASATRTPNLMLRDPSCCELRFSQPSHDMPATPAKVVASTSPFQYGGGPYRPTPGSVILEEETTVLEE